MESCWILRARVDKGLRVRRERKKKSVFVTFRESIFSINIGQARGPGNSLEVQWLRLCVPMQRAQVRSLVGELRPHVLRPVSKNRGRHAAGALDPPGPAWLLIFHSTPSWKMECSEKASIRKASVSGND